MTIMFSEMMNQLVPPSHTSGEPVRQEYLVKSAADRPHCMLQRNSAPVFGSWLVLFAGPEYTLLLMPRDMKNAAMSNVVSNTRGAIQEVAWAPGAKGW